MTDAGGYRQENDSWEQSVAAMLTGMGDAVQRITQTTGTGISSDGKVTVELSANGTAKTVRINDERLPEPVRKTLDAAIKEAVNAAVSQLRTKQQEIKQQIIEPVAGGREPIDFLRLVDEEAADRAEGWLEQLRAGQVPPEPAPRLWETDEPEEPEDSAGWLRRNRMDGR